MSRVRHHPVQPYQPLSKLRQVEDCMVEMDTGRFDVVTGRAGSTVFRSQFLG